MQSSDLAIMDRKNSPAHQKYTAEQVAKALNEANGILAVAARRLGCTRQTIYNYINRYPTVEKAWQDASETMTDFVEGKLAEQIRNGNTTAIIFYLRTKGKDRGYVERQELAGADGGPVKIVVEYKK